MSIIAKSSGGGSIERKVVPAGNHVARCYGMIQIGTVEQEYMGEKKKLHKVMVDFELPLEMAVFKEGEEAKPFVISKDFTLSFNEKSTLRKMLESWRGKAFTDQEAANFDITKLVGAPCMLNIVHKASADGTKTYANITGITPIPKGLQCPEQVNSTRILAYDAWNQDLFMTLPEWLADKISATPEYKDKFAMDTPKQEAFNLDKVEDDSDSALPF
jgi:hypothetical protein